MGLFEIRACFPGGRMSKAKRIAGLLVVALAACTSSPVPPLKSLPPAAQSALAGFLGPDEQDTAVRLAEARKALEVGALRAPAEVRVANVLLARGLIGYQVQALLGARRIELVSFEAKCPLPGPPNHMMTLWLGSQALAFRNAGIEEMVDFALDQQRHRFLQRARLMMNNPDLRDTVAEYNAVATSPELALYRLEVVGSREALFSLLRDPSVFAVLVNEDETLVRAFRGEQAEMASRIIRRVPTTLMDPGSVYRELPPGVRGPDSMSTGSIGELPPIPDQSQRR